MRKIVPRPLTATGGLAYFGGPGNNYSMPEAVSDCVINAADEAARAACVPADNMIDAIDEARHHRDACGKTADRITELVRGRRHPSTLTRPSC